PAPQRWEACCSASTLPSLPVPVRFLSVSFPSPTSAWAGHSARCCSVACWDLSSRERSRGDTGARNCSCWSECCLPSHRLPRPRRRVLRVLLSRASLGELQLAGSLFFLPCMQP